MEGQLSVRGLVIGCAGCAVITASSVYVALKMGALPWPIVFAAILSLMLLRLVARWGKKPTSLNEANVAHTAMSSGAMIGGALAFTIPGAWMCGLADEVSWLQVAVIAVSGAALGLVGSIAFRRHFVEDAQLEFPIGQAAAETLRATESTSGTGRVIAGAGAFACIWAYLRDGLALVPAMVAQLPIPGVVFGIYLSPMMAAVGFLVGVGALAIWFAGGVIANFGIVWATSAAGIWDVEFAKQVASCLGMGCMVGAGLAVVVRDIIPKALRSLASAWRQSSEDAPLVGLTAQSAFSSSTKVSKCDSDADRKKQARGVSVGAIVCACAVVAISLLLDLPVIVSIVVVACAFVACAMSAQSVGQTGIDPMEIFGLIALLLIAIFVDLPEAKLFFIAAIVAVACGLAGDVMNDFKAGAVLGTSPKAQWIAQAVGALVGCLFSVGTLYVMLQAFGADAFGPGREFVSAQASVVATLVTGIPVMWAFLAGIALGLIPYFFGFPTMMLGLGIYLPFYMSLTAFLGCLAKISFDLICKAKGRSMSEEQRDAFLDRAQERGLVVASGLIGGESVMGIILALAVAAGTLL